MNSTNTWTNRILASSLLRRSRRTVRYLSRLLGNTRKQHPTNHCLQETNTHWQTTWPNVLQSYFTQRDYGTNLDKKSTNCLRLRRQFDRRNQALALNTVFIKNNYSTDFIERNTYVRPNDSSNHSYTTTAPIPYVRETSETIARILRPHNIRFAHQPMFTLRRLLTNVKDKDEPEDRPRAVHKIKCTDCQATYVGKTGRNLTTRLNEHKRATKKGDVKNNIAEHHLKTSHTNDWDSAACLTYSTDYYQQITLESWFTNLEQTALNRCQPLPAPYKWLLNRNSNTLFIIDLTTHYLHNLSPHTFSQPITSRVYQRLLYLLTDQIAHQSF